MDVAATVTERVLTNIPVILERIFKYMNARQLNTCARVCKVWCDQGRREKSSREKHFHKLRWNYFKYTEGLDDKDGWCDKVKDFILASPLEPACLLMFCTETLWCNSDIDPAPGQSLESFLKVRLPSLCVFELVVTDGIIGTNEKMESEEMEEYIMAVSLVMIGKSKGMKFHHFSTSLADCKQLVKYSHGKTTKLPACLQILSQEEVKMVNLYCPMNGIDSETSHSFFKLFHQPLIAGGFVNKKVYSDLSGILHSSDDGCAVLGLVLCGQRVNVASVLIPSGVQEEKQVESLIQDLARAPFPMDQSFGLMYACVGRGVHVYDKNNVESKVFRKYFPKSPLLGFFGNGEIGCNFFPQDTFEKVPKLLHAYTTIMCLVACA